MRSILTSFSLILFASVGSSSAYAKPVQYFVRVDAVDSTVFQKTRELAIIYKKMPIVKKVTAPEYFSDNLVVRLESTPTNAQLIGTQQSILGCGEKELPEIDLQKDLCMRSDQTILADIEHRNFNDWKRALGCVGLRLVGENRC